MSRLAWITRPRQPAMVPTPRARPRPGPRWPPRSAAWSSDQPGSRRQRPARPVHRSRDPRRRRGPDQRQARHQPRQHGPDAPVCLHPGGARFPRHHPRGPPEHAAPGRPPILCPIHEDTPGPSLPDLDGLREGKVWFRAAGDPAEQAAGKLALTVICDELSRIVKQRAAHDPNLHCLDGRAVFGEADLAGPPLPDQLHPDAATHRRIGERFAAGRSRPAARSLSWGTRQPDLHGADLVEDEVRRVRGGGWPKGATTTPSPRPW